MIGGVCRQSVVAPLQYIPEQGIPLGLIEDFVIEAGKYLQRLVRGPGMLEKEA